LKTTFACGNQDNRQDKILSSVIHPLVDPLPIALYQIRVYQGEQSFTLQPVAYQNLSWIVSFVQPRLKSSPHGLFRFRSPRLFAELEFQKKRTGRIQGDRGPPLSEENVVNLSLLFSMHGIHSNSAITV